MKQHFYTLDFLRGVAALMVVLFHYSNGMLPTITNNYFSEMLSFGKYGVQIFFVISGFIIPFSMDRRNYQHKNFGRNLLRRFIRIDPPSYVAMLMSIFLYYLAVFLLGRGISGVDWPGLTFVSIVGNLTYTVPFLDTRWFNPVFWTLAIEFQFYILIGLILPFFNEKVIVNLSILTVILFLGFIKYHWFFQYGSFFVLGILIFLYKKKKINVTHFVIFTLVALLTCYLQRSFSEAVIASVTFMIVVFNWPIRTRVTTFLGLISYSLYIIHPICGPALEIIMKRFFEDGFFENHKLLFLALYTSTAIFFSFIFHLLIEKPFLKFSKIVSY